MGASRAARISALGSLLLWSATARADFHLMRISEVMTHAGGDSRVQAVELESTAFGQNRVGDHFLASYDSSGREWARFVIPDDVANPANGSKILFGSQAFADAASAPPDFILPDGFLPPFAGRVCFENIDCFAYGDFIGSNGTYGSPADRPGITGVASYRRVRTSFPLDNSTDYELGAPTFQNNAGAAVTIDVADPECFFADDLDDPSNWDVPTAGAGLDLESCGVPFVADIGTATVEGGVLLLSPSATDQLDIGNPLGIVTLSNAAALPIVENAEDEAYRLRMDLRAQRGIVQAAVFLRQHNLFADGVMDSAQGGGIGLNFSFGCHQPDAPPECPDNTSDHYHPDFRIACLQEGSVDRGPRDGLFQAIDTLEADTDYTFVMDVDGDDMHGPLTIGVKMFPAGGVEPVGYDEVWQSIGGLGFLPDEDFDRAVLIAALRSSGVAPGPALEVSNISVCAIPRTQRFVRFLECRREVTGAIEVTWDNPYLFDGGDIRVLVDGDEVDVLDQDDTTYFLGDPPDKDFDIAIVNGSGVPVSCSLCKNDPPVVDIDAPESVTLVGESAMIVLDASGSSDPEGNEELFYFWSVESAPEGAQPRFDDATAARATLTVDREGEYTLSVSVTDSGCAGDDLPQSGEGVHIVTVLGETSGPGFRRGDCNGSGAVDLSDAVFYLNHLFNAGAEPPCLEACDGNDDGRGDLSDAISILGYLFLGGAKPPAPGPDACGTAPGGIVLGCDTPAC